MNKKDIQVLFEYNCWANTRMLDAVSVLTPEQLKTDLATSHQSMHGTLTHLLSAEWIWLMRCTGSSPKALFDPVDFPTLDSLKAKLTEVGQDQKRFIEELSDEGFEQVISYTNTKVEQWEYPLQHIMQHVVNHSTYHRGQITTMLRQLGAKAVMTDFIFYFDEKSATS